MTKARLVEIMRKKHSYVAYEEEHLDSFLLLDWSKVKDEDTLAWYFVDYLVSQGLAEVSE